jgi:hypothetical protein
MRVPGHPARGLLPAQIPAKSFKMINILLAEFLQWLILFFPHIMLLVNTARCKEKREIPPGLPIRQAYVVLLCEKEQLPWETGKIANLDRGSICL